MDLYNYKMATTVGFIISSAILLASQVNCHEAILHISNGTVQKEYCLVYNQSWTHLAESLDSAAQYPLLNLIPETLCGPTFSRPAPSPALMNGSAVVVLMGDCNISQQALFAESLGAKALLVASSTVLFIPSANESDYAKVHIPLAVMKFRDLVDTKRALGGKGLQVQMYAPVPSSLDPSMVVMLLLACSTVALGGYWSSAGERQRLSGGGGGGGGAGGGENKAEAGEVFLYSPLKVVIFVGIMCLMLVLMYFFYSILVYVVIAIFCLASATALFSCCDAILEQMGCGTVRFSIRNWKFSLRSLLLSAVCISIAVIWGVYRNEERWIWVLQDLLGVAFCLNFMKTVSLSNFKVCVILLSLLLVYDVFFVFITPFFTKNGVSIMVQVALGPDAFAEKTPGNVVGIPAEPQTPTEKLPLVMRVPRFSAQNLCWLQFSILGYGDIIIPGLLVAYCSRFDVWVNSSRNIYLLSCCIAYLLGVIVTFAVMLLTKTGQPALLYLVPFTVLTSAAVAAYRREMKHFWTGSSYEVLDPSREPLLSDGRNDGSISGDKC